MTYKRTVIKQLLWRLVEDGRTIAAFTEEHDARGFARARYPHAELIYGASELDLVRSALRKGCEFTRDIAEMTGISQRHVSSYLSELKSKGEVFTPGRRNVNGNALVIYKLTEVSSA